MTVHRWNDIKRDKLSPEKVAEIEARAATEARRLTRLRELRKHLRLTQEEMAKRAGMKQAEISQAEKRTDHKISTVERYVHMAGGRLEMKAVFPDGQEIPLLITS